MDCNNTNLKRGSKGDKVREAQTLLSSRGFYGGRIDGDFGSYTEEAVRNFQRSQGGLAVDGVIGPVTCRKLQQDTGRYTNTTLCERQGGNCLGQITAYHCGPHSVKQALRKFGITDYSEKTIGGYAGTTSNGTGHPGLNTAIEKIARLEGINLKVEWKNFSDLGSNRKERFKKLGQLMTAPNTSVFWHELYRNQYGHYSLAKTINVDGNLTIANSLGNRCSYPAYCGYMESRSMGTQESYYGGISQKSVCIITSEGQTGRGEQDMVTEDIPTLVQLVTNEEKDTTYIHEAEDKQEYINGLQEIIEEAYTKQGLTDEILQLQVEVNKLRHEYDIHDPTEVINKDDNGEYVQ